MTRGGEGSRIKALYSRAKEDLESKITNGVYKQGDFIPCEQELESYYRVSRTTVRKAITMLVGEGFLTNLSLHLNDRPSRISER